MSCQSDFCISSLNQSFRASMDWRLICNTQDKPIRNSCARWQRQLFTHREQQPTEKAPTFRTGRGELWAPTTHNGTQIAHLLHSPSGALSFQVLLATVPHSFGSPEQHCYRSHNKATEEHNKALHEEFQVALCLQWGSPVSVFQASHDCFTLLPLSYTTNAAGFYLTDEDVCGFKMPSIHFRWFTRNRFYFNTHFLAFFCHFHWLVVYFNTCNYSNVNKL